jgi:hypothetical protein
LAQTDEGELHWVAYSKIFSTTLSAANEGVLKHYFEIGKNSDDIYVGAVNVVDEKPIVNWETLGNYAGNN